MFYSSINKAFLCSTGHQNTSCETVGYATTHMYMFLSWAGNQYLFLSRIAFVGAFVNTLGTRGAGRDDVRLSLSPTSESADRLCARTRAPVKCNPLAQIVYFRGKGWLD